MLCRRWTDSGQLGVSVTWAQAVVDLYRGYRPPPRSGRPKRRHRPAGWVSLAHGLTDTVHTAVITLLAEEPAQLGDGLAPGVAGAGRWRKHGYEVESIDPQQKLLRGSALVV